MIRKLIASAAAAALLAGAANAVILENNAGALGSEPYPLAGALDFAGGAVTAPASTPLVVGIAPSAGAFPTGNILVYVDVTGAEFVSALTGGEFSGGTTTSVISSGGGVGTSSVVFLVSGANSCTSDFDPATIDANCTIALPLELNGADVSVSVGITTDAGAPVDNTSATVRVSRTLVDIAPAFAISFAPDTVPTIADLNATPGPFEDFTTLSDGVIGTYQVLTNSVSYAAALPRSVNRDLAGNPVDLTDVASVDLVLSGTMDAFAGTGAPFTRVTFGGVNADNISAATDVAEFDAVAQFGAGAQSVDLTPDGVTPIARSDYSLSVTVVPAPASPLTAGTTAVGVLQSIERNGTQVTFPWTQTQTLGSASGTSSVFRIGNLDNVPAGAVFVEVKNTAAAPGYSNPGIVQLASSIPANGELVQNSQAIETAVGNYGRGDIEFTIEADPETLTARQFVVRNGVIQQVIGGNVNQDINN